LGQAVAKRTCKLIHFSTDFVFDGKASAPYIESDQPRPASVYGRSKLSGEAALLKTCTAESLTIIRTAWLFGPGKKNFVATICGLAAEREQLKIVDDQRGSPTYTPDLAQYAVDLVDSEAFGIFHVVNAGDASWFELAHKAVKAAGIPCEVLPIPSSEYPQKAERPVYSVLSTEKFQRVTGTEPRHWQQAVQEYVNSEIRTT
jgi:dTDP-4-dehydrorhamnose reductase